MARGDRPEPEIRGRTVILVDDGSLDRTVEFAQEHALYIAAFNHLTPFPGTPLYARMAAEGRLIDPTGWERCTVFDVNVRGTKLLMEECLRAEVERVVYTSSAAAVGPAAHGKTADETQLFTAGRLGIEVVYQDLALADNLDIVQNMFLGRERGKSWLLDEADYYLAPWLLRERVRVTLVHSASITPRMNSSGSWSRIPAPSPVFGSAPAASNRSIGRRRFPPAPMMYSATWLISTTSEARRRRISPSTASMSARASDWMSDRL